MNRPSIAALLLTAALVSLPAIAQDPHGRPPPPPPPGGRPGQRPPPPPPPPEQSAPAPTTTAPAPVAQAAPSVASPAAIEPRIVAPVSPTADEEATLAEARGHADRDAIGQALLALAREHLRLHQPDQALPRLEEATRLANESGDDRLGREAAVAGAEAYAQLGDSAMEATWSEQAEKYRERIASGIAPPPVAAAPTPLPATPAQAGSAGNDAGSTAATEPPAAPPPSHPARWLWLILPLALVFFWAWLRSQRKAETLRDEADRLQRHKRQLSQANSSLQQQAERLRQAVVQDPLTGASTRPAFARALEDALLHSAHYGKPVALMVFDLDHFKSINDTHGHLTGDAALKLVAGIVRENLGSDDLFGRFGGDEFLIGCADHDGVAALAIAERIRAAVASRAASENPAMAGLSLSIGIAIADGGNGYRSELLFHRADAALYSAKRGGRNRSVLADPQTPEPPREAHAPRTLSA